MFPAFRQVYMMYQTHGPHSGNGLLSGAVGAPIRTCHGARPVRCIGALFVSTRQLGTRGAGEWRQSVSVIVTQFLPCRGCRRVKCKCAGRKVDTDVSLTARLRYCPIPIRSGFDRLSGSAALLDLKTAMILPNSLQTRRNISGSFCFECKLTGSPGGPRLKPHRQPRAHRDQL